MKTLVAIAGLVIAVAVARADAPKPQPRVAKLPASERVFVRDKDAPSTDKTAPLYGLRPALKQK